MKKTIIDFWNRWSNWIIILILGAVILKLSFADVIAGWNAGSSSADSANPSTTWSVLIIVLPILLLIMLGIFLVFGGLHYQFIFKPILKTYKTPNVILYIMVSTLVYGYLLNDYVLKKMVDDPKSNQSDYFTYWVWVVSLMFSIVYDFRRNEQLKQKLEKERNQAEISALKAQINPHFLFNTLNNLYGTAMSEGSAQTATGIQQLSAMMRHVVEESKNETTTVAQEIKFLNDYLDLHLMRLPKRDNIKINTAINWDEKPAAIAPLLLIPFVENAFKYGISLTHDCFVQVALLVEDHALDFKITNSVMPSHQLEAGTGTGIENVKKRLELLYSDQHTLKTSHENGIFDVHLTLTLKPTP